MHTVHRVQRGEGKERVQNVVLQSQLGCREKISLIYDRSIQKSDGSREEAILES